MSMTIQEVISSILKSVPGTPWDDSVDTLKTGDPNQEVSGIVTTFIATVEVIKKAASLGVNLIITHEPTFYNHKDEATRIEKDPVYQTKLRLLQEYRIAVWRFHDYWHFHKPDGICTGFLKETGWEKYRDNLHHGVLTIPSMTLSELIEYLKEQLSINSLRFVGDPSMDCQNIALLLGSPGGQFQLEFLMKQEVDVVICGETPEWQTCEYVRDALFTGIQKSIIVLGHCNSEEAGMKYLCDWLQPKVADVPITFIPAGDPLKFS